VRLLFYACGCCRAGCTPCAAPKRLDYWGLWAPNDKVGLLLLGAGEVTIGAPLPPKR
jgi:hypothetical protein